MPNSSPFDAGSIDLVNRASSPFSPESIALVTKTPISNLVGQAKTKGMPLDPRPNPLPGHGAPDGPMTVGLLPNVEERLDQMEDLFPGLHLTSGYRDPAHNAEVGGVPNSLHTQGRATDLVGSPEEMQAAYNWAKANGATEVLIHDVGSGPHLHVGW